MRDIQKYLDAAEAAKEDVESEVALLSPMLRTGWDAMSDESRANLLADKELIDCDAAGQCYDAEDPDYVRPKDLTTLLANARQHGDDSDEPEHEVVDLQTYLIAFERHTSDAEWDAFVESAAAQKVLSAGGSSPAP